MQKDNHQTEVPQKDNSVYQTLSLFLKDGKGMYLYRKSEKIAKAFFLLTQHLDDTQSIKVNLRNGALSLIEKSQLFLMSDRVTEDSVKEVVLKLMSVISLSDIALSARFISETNHKIISSQIELFLSEIHEHASVLVQSKNLIPANLFSVSDIEQLFTSSRTEQKDNPESFVPARQPHSIESDSLNPKNLQVFKNKETYPSSEIPQRNAPLHKNIKQALSPVISTVKIPTEGIVDGNKNQRQNSILDVIRRKGESSIKDLTDVIKGCSEKTIQRELIALVSSGVLLKKGERRWSRYSMSN
jgi:hypothetical protein